MRRTVEQWLDVVELEATTRERYEDLIRLYLLPTFGNVQVGRLRGEVLNSFSHYDRLIV